MTYHQAAGETRRRQSRTAVVLAGLAAAALLAGAGPASAAVHPGRTPRASAPGTISTIAGGLGGPGVATQITLGATGGLVYSGGSLYLSDEPAGATESNGALRRIDPSTDELAAVAGDGSDVYSDNGGPATAASLNPGGVTADAAGNLVVVDTGRIRVVATHTGTYYGQAMTAGHIYSIAGDGQNAISGLGGLATKAGLGYEIGDLAVDASGNIVVTDNPYIFVIAGQTGEFYGKAMTAGHLYKIAGTGKTGYSGNKALAIDAKLDNPQGVAVDVSDNVVFSDYGNNRIRVIAGQTGEFYGQAMTAGHIYSICGTGYHVYHGDGVPARTATLWHPTGLTIDAAGNILVADYGHYRLRAIAASTGEFYGQAMTQGDIYTIAGDGSDELGPFGGPATSTAAGYLSAVTVDGNGNVVIGDEGNYPVMLLAEHTGEFYGQAMTQGDLYAIAGNASNESGIGGPATSAVLPDIPDAVSDAAGNTVIDDLYACQVLVLAHATGTFYGRAMTAGDLYRIAGVIDGCGYTSDGGPATAADLNDNSGVALDSHGNVVIADQGNNRVRVVAESTGTFYGQAMTKGDIYTIAGTGTGGFSGDGGPGTQAELASPSYVTADSHGNVLINDRDNFRIRVVAGSTGTFYGQAMTAGDIYTIAGTGTPGYSGDGGPATSAEFNLFGLSTDTAGNILVADAGNQRIRVIAESTGEFYGQAMTAGDVYTVLGAGTSDYRCDGGPAASAGLNFPQDVVADGAGNLVIADTSNDQVCVLAEATGTFYGVAMTAGNVYTVAGTTGTNGFSGDGGPATSARLGQPDSVALDPAGNLLVSDFANARVREITG